MSSTKDHYSAKAFAIITAMKEAITDNTVVTLIEQDRYNMKVHTSNPDKVFAISNHLLGGMRILLSRRSKPIEIMEGDKLVSVKYVQYVSFTLTNHPKQLEACLNWKDNTPNFDLYYN